MRITGIGLLAGSFVVAFAITKLYAITVNPASNVTADSANTAETVVLRDTSGNFSAGTITANIVGSVSGGVIQANAPIQLYARTSAQIATLVPAASGYMLMNITAATPCISTGTGAGAWVYISTDSTVAKAVCQ